ncbi:MAG: hypothetical protein ISS72_04165 [Candidatus Brocadiae bacterium]|nr:hypothetical protein [Candidatus Brocadiia bacterium]
MSERARQLVDQLRSFRTRSQVMEGLLMLGDDAVPELIQALGHPMENVRWSAQQVLTQLGGDAVVEQLVAALEDPTRQKEAADTLRQITGQSIGVDRRAWATWLQSRGGAPLPAATPVREAAPPATSPAPRAAASAPRPAAPSLQGLDDETIIKAATAGADIDVRQHSGGYVLTVPLEGNRRQRVTVSFTAQDFEDEDLVVVYTECGPAQQKNFEWALRQNLRMSFGAIAIRDRGGQPTFVMVNTHPRKTLDVDELRKSIVLLASKGDKLEQALTKDDER